MIPRWISTNKIIKKCWTWNIECLHEKWTNQRVVVHAESSINPLFSLSYIFPFCFFSPTCSSTCTNRRRLLFLIHTQTNKTNDPPFFFSSFFLLLHCNYNKNEWDLCIHLLRYASTCFIFFLWKFSLVFSLGVNNNMLMDPCMVHWLQLCLCILCV